MSDFEDEWDPVDLNTYQTSASLVPQGIDSQIAPRGRSIRELRQPGADGQAQRPKYQHGTISRDYRPALQAVYPSATQNNRNNARLQRVEVEESLEDRVVKLESYSRYMANKDSPDSIYEMMHVYKNFYKALRGRDNLAPANEARHKLAHICMTSGAFVEIPLLNSNKFKIWGNEGQIKQVKLLLEAWEMHVRAPGFREGKNTTWAKDKAVDGREEHRLMREALKQHEDNMFQNYADSYVCPFEAYLIWPNGYDLEQYIADFEPHVLEQIRRQYTCRITHEKVKTRVTKVAAQNESDVLAVYHRLFCLYKKMIARKKRGIKLNQCRLPSIESYRDYISLQKTQISEDPRDTMDLPILTGQNLRHEESDQWTRLGRELHNKCHATTKTALRSCLSALYVSEKHVRMRVTFGKLGLTKYKKPRDNEDNYFLDEFVAMVQHRDIEMQQQPLSTGCGDGDFARFISVIDALGAMDQFGQPTYAWAVHCDFQGNQSFNTLRLEIEFEPSIISDEEAEKHTTRWLNYNTAGSLDTEELLTINMMDFDRVGYQIHLGAVDMSTNTKIVGHLRSFADNVQYTPARDRIKGAPKKRATFPPGSTELRAVKEISIARYPFKNGDGTFELRRVDIFPQSVEQACLFPARTEWHASYYYQGWDSLLSEFAYIKPGEDVTFQRNLNTFFPRNTDPDRPQMLPQGFKNFMREIEEIKDLLTSALK